MKILKFNEMKINLVKTNYQIHEYPCDDRKNPLYKNDYFLTFNLNGHNYYVILEYCEKNNIQTYNIVITTHEQYSEFYDKYMSYINNGITLTNDQCAKLAEIVEKETNLNEFIPLVRSVLYIISDFYPKINGALLSLFFTTNQKKLKLWRNIIKDSVDWKEFETTENGEKFYYYKVN